jgi:release factor glutamine methyltransferase
MTIQNALDVRDRSVSYRDAEVLLGAVLQMRREALLAHPEHELSDDQEALYHAHLLRREENEPVAYITGVREFYGLPIKSDHRALIARPESELLVTRGVTFLAEHFHHHLKATNKPCPVRILELGTGCGAISIALAIELAKLGVPAELIVTDVEQDPLDLAQENWTTLQLPENKNLTRMEFLVADLFANPRIAERAPFDAIITNLPYIPAVWAQNPAAQPDVIFYEPDLALFGGEDGLDLYRQFWADAPNYIKPNGLIAVEHDEDQGEAMRSIAHTAFPDTEPRTFQDYGGYDRVTELVTSAA